MPIEQEKNPRLLFTFLVMLRGCVQKTPQKGQENLSQSNTDETTSSIMFTFILPCSSEQNIWFLARQPK